MGLNAGQQFAYNVLMAGYNVFLTGGAGVGKTYVINKFVEDARNIGKNVMVCAPTGIAALNINGVTIHRQFRAPLGVITYQRSSYSAPEELYNTDVVIVDEISMCRIDLFDFMLNKVADANEVRKTSGKYMIQVVVVGDFFQLPPVIREYDKRALDDYYKFDIGAGFAFYSRFWNMLNFKNIMLTEIVRQTDKEFISNLNNIRVGNKAYIDMIFNQSCKQEINGAITLCGTNREATEKNIQELNRIDRESTVYYANVVGDVTKEDTLAEVELELREGARVMTLLNQDGYNNGLLGTVVGLYDDSIVVQMDNGITVDIRKARWDIFRYELEALSGNTYKLVETNVGYIEQFPLKLAYAITIHKSQGQTYDAVNLNPYCWDCGQLYVAISRVRSLSNLHFNYAPDMSYMVVSLNVIKFYNSLNFEDINSQVTERYKTPAKQSFGDDMDSLLNKLNNL